jgi:hypothetical protein
MADDSDRKPRKTKHPYIILIEGMYTLGLNYNVSPRIVTHHVPTKNVGSSLTWTSYQECCANACFREGWLAGREERAQEEHTTTHINVHMYR